jgi:hypothetical protein
VANWYGYSTGLLPDNLVSYKAAGPDQVTFQLNRAYSTIWFTYDQLGELKPMPESWDVTSLTGAPGSGGCITETTSSKLAAGDVDGLAGLGDSVDGLVALGAGLVRAIPIAGTVIAGGLTIYQDRELGDGWDRSVADGVVSSGAALGSAVGTAAVIGALWGTASVLPVAGAVVFSGVVAVGVGDFVHNMFQENWSADFHKYGLVDGTGHGIADSYDKTRHDLAHMWDDIF